MLSVGIDGAAQQQCPASSSWVEDGMWAAEAGLVREGGCSNHPSSHDCPQQETQVLTQGGEHWHHLQQAQGADFNYVPQN